MTELTRRRTVLAAMSAGATALAGCLVEDGGTGDDGDDDGDDQNNGDDNQNDNQDDGDDSDGENGTPASVVETEMVHAWSDCGGDDGEAAVVRDGASYAVDGVVTAPDPCHEPVLTDANVTDGELRVSVDVAQAELGEDEVCPTCVGAVGYSALIDLDTDDAVERVLVSHGDQEYEILSEDFSTDPHVHESAIETTDASCGNSGVDEADASLEDGTLTVNGRLSASNPCHRAQLDDVSVVGGELNVKLSLAEVEQEEGADVGGCVDCIGEIAYEATVELLNDEVVEEIVIDHAGGENHTF